MFFFSVQLVGWVQISVCLLFFLWRQSSVSQWEMINSKLHTAFDFIVLKFSKPPFLFPTVFFLVQPGKKYNWFFFLHFVIYLVPVHSGSILPSMLPMSPLFFFVPVFDFLCIQRLNAVLLKAMQQWFPPILLSKGDRKTSQWKNGNWGNCEQWYCF